MRRSTSKLDWIQEGFFLEAVLAVKSCKQMSYVFCVDGTAQTKAQSWEHVACLERQYAMWPGMWDGTSHDAAGTPE